MTIRSAHRPPAAARRLSLEWIVRSRIVYHLPTALPLVVQLVPLALLPALITGALGNSALLSLLIGVPAATILFDAIAVHLPKRPARPASAIPPTAAVAIVGLGILAFSAKTIIQPTFTAEVLGRTAPPVAALLTPFEAWPLVGLSFLFFEHARTGVPSRRYLWLVTAATIGAYSFLWLLNGFLGGAAGFAFTVGWMAVTLGLLRFRSFAALLLVAIIFWRPVGAIRNSLRVSAAGSVTYVSEVSYDRLRADKFWLEAHALREEHFLARPGIAQVIRVGLLPRAVDRGRTTTSAGPRLGEALLGRRGTSLGFTVLGNIYLFDGWSGLMLYLALGSLVVRLALNRSSPMGFAVYAGAVSNLYWLNISYPDNIAALLHFAIAAAVALALVRVAVNVARSYRYSR